MQAHLIECRKCLVSKPASEFARYNNRGHVGIRKTCQACTKLEPRFPRTANKQREYGSDKKCSRCKTTLPIDQFALRKSWDNGRMYRNSFCQTCCATIRRKRYATEEGHDKIRDGAMKAAYGIGIEEYRHKHEQQHGLCAICGKPENGHPQRQGSQVGC